MTTVLFLHLTTNAKDETMSTLSETQWLSFSGGSFIEIIRDHIPSRCIHFRHIFAFQTSRTFQVSQQQQAIGAKATTVRHGIRLFLRRRGLPGQSWPTGIQGTRSGGPNDEPLLQHKVTGLGNKPMELTKEKSLAMIAGWMARIGQITKNCLEIKLQHATRYN